MRVRGSQGATFVELFFDLVFVYAVTQLTSAVLRDLSWAGVARAALLFWLVWWAWTQFTWTLNLADTENTWVRLLTLAASAIAFFLAQSIPDAFAGAGAWFAISYVVVRLIGLSLHGWVLAGDDEQRTSSVNFASASMVGLALALAGGFVGPNSRAWFWLAVIIADLVTAGVAGRGVWDLDSAHFTERHGLIVIIALGESLIAAGLATAGLERDLIFAVTTAGAVVATCALWWTYFGSLHHRVAERMEAETSQHRGSFARDVYSFWHAAVIAGVIGIAVGFEEAIADPGEMHAPQRSCHSVDRWNRAVRGWPGPRVVASRSSRGSVASVAGRRVGPGRHPLRWAGTTGDCDVGPRRSRIGAGALRRSSRRPACAEGHHHLSRTAGLATTGVTVMSSESPVRGSSCTGVFVSSLRLSGRQR